MSDWTRKELSATAAHYGLVVSTYSPGDGLARYRFAPLGGGERQDDYFAAAHGYTVLGLRDACIFLHGVIMHARYVEDYCD